MKLETERLEIIPLTAVQLKLWTQDIASLEKELAATYRAEPMEGIFSDIVKNQLQIVQTDPGMYLWRSFWMLIRKADRIIIGSADFKDIPNARGEVEIGYGLGQAYEHNGYMTEAVGAMCFWAFGQTGVQAVIAETETNGDASQRVLRRCGFTQYRRGETLWWIKENGRHKNV